ncbi:hypothetical protein [Amycolatopsis sp. 195334CR]|uniref:hypothetical protein n=1 Tax=Amycolatopsis sp. 195334CR TaxID=2814588 RepID=UPI001A8E03BD|nr:hypothetical protein [Amycolatopsis sp. 195334CR]MBN6041378.1 hypothetical protein [Amycolatopsis sp. 195334CR]
MAGRATRHPADRTTTLLITVTTTGRHAVLETSDVDSCGRPSGRSSSPSERPP